MALGKFAASIVRRTLRQPSNSLLRSLEKGGFLASELTEDFRHRLEDYHFLSFSETIRLGNFGIVRISEGCPDDSETA